MTAPNLQAEGTLAVVTTGNLTVAWPSHQADDVLIANVVFYAPNSTGGVAVSPPGDLNTIPGPSIGSGASADSMIRAYWKRATSGSETNPTFTRTLGDTGADTCLAGRAYVIRGCITTGDPWDEQEFTPDESSDPYQLSNLAFPALTVSGPERTVIQFLLSCDNQSAGAAPSGWTAGTAVTTATGTDAGFQTFRQENVSSDTAADASAVATTLQGYAFWGASFRPPTPLGKAPQLKVPSHRRDLIYR